MTLIDRRKLLTAVLSSPLVGCDGRGEGPAPRSAAANRTEATMLQLRRASERGHANHGWLDSYHSFSFASYHDPRFMGFRHLRVINEDRVQPSRGFGTHPHRDMEIISYVLHGGLEHRDSMGNGSVIKPGDVQRMTAGTGVTHSEYNASSQEHVHFLQIWILPERAGLTPGYEQKFFSEEEKKGKLRLLASREGRDGSITVHQDLALHAGILGAGESVEHALRPGRHAWVQVVRGAVSVNGQQLSVGDGAALSQEAAVQIAGLEGGSEVLLFDMALSIRRATGARAWCRRSRSPPRRRAPARSAPPAPRWPRPPAPPRPPPPPPPSPRPAPPAPPPAAP